MQTIQSKGLSAFSLLKLLFIGLLIPIFVFAFACGIASLFGAQMVMLNNQYVFGWKGLITGAIIGVILPGILSFIFWIIMGLGLWIFTRFSTIKLSIKE